MRYTPIAVLVAIVLVAVNPAGAQTPPTTTPPPERLAAARELVQVMKATDQFKALLPVIFQNLKAAIVQNRPEMEKQYEAMVPVFTAAANDHVNDVVDQLAQTYARHFNADEIHQMTAFYRTPIGQKLITEQPAIARETLAAGQQFGRALAIDLQTRAFEALRKQGSGN